MMMNPSPGRMTTLRRDLCRRRHQLGDDKSVRLFQLAQFALGLDQEFRKRLAQARPRANTANQTLSRTAPAALLRRPTLYASSQSKRAKIKRALFGI